MFTPVALFVVLLQCGCFLLCCLIAICFLFSFVFMSLFILCCEFSYGFCL